MLATALVVLLLQHQHSRLHSFARTDALTGLANHGSFHETLPRTWIALGSRARRSVS